MRCREEQIAAIAALDEPNRRGLYDYVVRQPTPVSRDEAAAALDLPRTTAAFHLDRLVDEGLLDVVYQRRTGRTGPGAGRPAKLYQRSPQQVVVSLPQRRYDLAGRLLAGALEHAERSGDSPRASLDQRAYQLGRELGGTARGADGGPADECPADECPADEGTADDGPAAGDNRDIALRVLQVYGFEPRVAEGEVTLANCPFHTLAQEYTDVVCGMNLRLLDGLLDGLAPTGLTARLHPTPPHCCVRLRGAD